MTLVLDAVTGANAAWSTGRKLGSTFTLAPADTASGAFVLIRDQAGAHDATASGAPAQGSGTINGNAYARLDGANDKFTFPALTLGSGDWTMLLAAGFTGVLAGPVIGNTTLATSLTHNSATGFAIYSDGAGPLTYGTSWAIPKGFHILRLVRMGGTIQLFQNGEAIGAPRTLAGAFTFDQLGAAVSAWAQLGLGECLIYPRALTAAEAATVEADMATAWRSAIYINDMAGNDANTGWEPGSALKTIAAVRPLHLRRGSKILLKAGGVWRRDPLLFNQSFQTGDTGAPFIIDKYGSGAQPKIIGSTLVAGPYTLVTGTEYKKTVVLTNIQCVWVHGSVTIIRLVPGMAGSLASGQYAYAGGELHFNFGAAVGGVTVEVAQQDSGLADIYGCRPARPYMNVSNLHLIHWPSDGFSFDAANCSARNILSEWNAFDGIGGAAANLYVGQSISQHNGKGRAISGAAGDGISLHGGTSIVIEDTKLLFNDKAGVDHQETVNATMRNCWIEGNNQNIWSASNVGPVATQIWENCVVVRRPGDYAIACQLGRSTNHVLRHMTIVNMDVASNFRAVNVNTTGSVTVQNCVTDGFFTGIGVQAGMVVHDHNLHNCTNAYNGTGAGAGDLTGDPKFTDRAGADYSLLTGSPCINCGDNLGVPVDYLHKPRPFNVLPDRGGYERQSI